MILFIGAGVSTSAGLPTWNQLMITICQVFFEHWRFQIDRGSARIDHPPRELSVAFSEPWGDEALAIGEEFAKGNPVLVAQQIKNCVRDLDWIYLLRKSLYGDENSKGTEGSVLLERLAALCSDRTKVHAVVNYNYDSVLEERFLSKNIPFTVLQEKTKGLKRERLPIYHVHGYLKRGGGDEAKIMLAEDDYHEELVAPYSWSNLLQSSFLICSTCLFIGTSMTDPNLRRLLRSAYSVGKRFHYAFLPKNDGSTKAVMSDALFDKDLYSLGVASIRYPAGGDEEFPHACLPRCLDWLMAPQPDRP
jgi:hypothetical protein